MRCVIFYSRPLFVLVRRKKLSGLAFVFCLCAAPSAFAQTPAGDHPAQAVSPAVAPKPPDVSKEALVFDKLLTRVREEADGTGTRQTTARIRVLADAGVKNMAVLTFTYTASSQQIDVGYVRVIKPDGSVVVTPDYNIQDMPADVTREAPMYSDIHQKHVAVRGLGVGDTIEYQVTQRTLKPDVPGHFWFDYSFEKNLIILDEELDLDLPADKPVTVASADLQPTVTESGGRKLYHWSSSNLARPDPDAPPKSTKNWKPSVQVTTFAGWEQVGEWYASLQKDQVAVTPAIQARADALTKGLTSNDDKLHAIFNEVALHIHYVGLDFGIGRYKPHPADDVLSNEYGDCKDKHTLLAALLKAAGIEAWPVLISSSRALDPATPSPAQFDHVITLVPLSGKLLWMDSTEEVSPIGVLYGDLRDKQALAIPTGKPAYLERTPADLPFLQSTRFHAEGKLSDQGVFTGHIDQAFRGDGELIIRSVFRSVPQSQWKVFLQNFSNNIGFAGEVSNPQVSSIEQLSQPLQFSYDYTREKFGEWDDRRITPPMPPVGMELAPGVKQIKPADDIDLGSPGEVVYSSKVELPPGWSMEYPGGIDLTENWAEYHSKYDFSSGVFSAERRLVVKKDKVPLADWDKYLAFRRAIYGDEAQMMALVESGAVNGGVGASPGSELTDLREQIYYAIKTLNDVTAVLDANPPSDMRKVSGATSQCQELVYSAEAKSTELAPNSPNSLYWAQALAAAWTCRGWAELESRDIGVAEIYLRPAWRLSQSRMSGYELGRVLASEGKKAEAMHLFELASVADVSFFPGNDVVERHLADDYKTLTGKDLTTTALDHGQYNGSLRSELDNELEIRQLLHATKLTGSGLYAVAFENGKAVKVVFLGGDSGFASLVPVLQVHAFPPELPTGSKALLVREVRVICTPWAGCDAYLLLPNAIQMPQVPIQTTEITPPNAPKGRKTIRIENLPVAPTQ